MKNLEDLSIGRKLGLLVGAGALEALCLAGLALWGVSAIHTQARAIQVEAHKASLARQVDADINEIEVHVAGSLLARHFDSLASQRILSLRKEYMAAFDELAAAAVTEEGKRLRGLLEDSVALWRATDVKIINLGEAGKVGEAISLYRAELEPQILAMRARMTDYLKYREQRMAALTTEQTGQISRIRTLMVVVVILCLAASLGFGLVLTRSITYPLGLAVAHLDEVAGGDVSRVVPPEYLARGDEIGSIAKAIETTSRGLRVALTQMNKGIQVMSSSSTALSANSRQMSTGSREASEKTHSVAAAVEEMTANAVHVAAGMEQTSTNLAAVASSTEQMTSTIGEIAANSEKARRITGDATQQAASISRQMNQLGQAAHEIGKVTETITEISSQTNLLALNATIEAARAGSAGKGFAVVANEIKALAQQTAAATEDIKGRIAGVQSSTAGGIAEIDKVSKVIHEVSDIVSAIAAAIEEQATVTRDIARSIGEASSGVRDANQRVAESSQATQDIAREIAGVDQAVRQMADGTDTVQSSAAELFDVADGLRHSIAQFRVSSAAVDAPHSFSAGPAFAVDSDILEKAVVAHSSWKTHLKDAISTGKLHVSVETLRADDQCAFGQWLHGSGVSPAQRQTEQYRMLQRLHARFHEEASKVAHLAIAGQKEAAATAMDTSNAFCMVSTELLNALQNCCAPHSS